MNQSSVDIHNILYYWYENKRKSERALWTSQCQEVKHELLITCLSLCSCSCSTLSIQSHYSLLFFSTINFLSELVIKTHEILCFLLFSLLLMHGCVLLTVELVFQSTCGWGSFSLWTMVILLRIWDSRPLDVTN